MNRLIVAVALPVLLLLASTAVAADPPPPPLAAATGKVEKVGKDTLTIQPREAGGKFGKPIVLKITGTSKVTTLTVRDQTGKPVATQRDTEVRDLRPNQAIAVLYTTLKDNHILLSAVVHPAEK